MGQGEIKGIKRRGVRLRRVGGVLAVPCDRRGGMLNGHIQSREKNKEAAVIKNLKAIFSRKLCNHPRKKTPTFKISEKGLKRKINVRDEDLRLPLGY